jgi:hypothetical protein
MEVTPVNTSLPALRRANEEAEAAYLDARNVYMVRPHEDQRLAMRDAAVAWRGAEDALNAAVDHERRQQAAEAMA